MSSDAATLFVHTNFTGFAVQTNKEMKAEAVTQNADRISEVDRRPKWA